jgi:type VI secretion system secreted protein VgrG
LHDAAHPPTYELPKHKTRTTFRTQTTPAEASANELRFEDLSGIQEMFINASRDMNYTVKNDNVMGVDRNHERIVGNNYNLSVAENLQRQVSHDQTWKVGGDEEFTVENTHSKGVEGDEVETVVGNRKLKIGSDVMYAVSKNRKLEVTGNLDEHAREGMFRYSAQSAEWTVGRSVTQTLQGQHLQQVTKDAIRSVGTAKLETCSGSHVTLANRDLTESVSGSMLLCSKRHFMNGAQETSQWTVGSSWSTVSPHIHVQAKEKILLKVGGSSITITPRDIHISTPSYELTNSASLVVKTKKVLHNS